LTTQNRFENNYSASSSAALQDSPVQQSVARRDIDKQQRGGTGRLLLSQ
jgi:hypothetical protein